MIPKNKNANQAGEAVTGDTGLEGAVAQEETAGQEPGGKPWEPKNKKLAKILSFAKAEKKSLIQIAALAIGIFAAAGLANMIVYDDSGSIFQASYNQANAEYNRLVNEIDIFKKTNPYYTGVDTSETQNQQKEVNWIGVKYDAGRAKADTQYFWEWISPAFSYDSAAEYNKNIAEFTSSKGLAADNLFVTTFLRHYDYTSVENADANGDGKATPSEIEAANRAYKCFTSKDVYAEWTRLVGTTADGDYHYMAMVPMATGASSKYYTMVLFTFTAKHTVNPTTGSDTISVADFNVWPPHSRQLTLINR